MSAFLDFLDVRLVDWRAGRPVWWTLAVLRYLSDLLGGRIILIPAEFVTDLASVPRLPIIWLATGGRGPRPSIPHDFAYQFGFWFLEDGTRLTVDKPLVDAVFWESLLADPISGAGRVRAWEMWAGVRSNIHGGIWGDRGRAAILNPIWTREGWPAQTP